MQTQQQTLETWAIVELMGHSRMAGFVAEATIGGAAMLRVDVPQGAAGEAPYTRYVGGAAIYAITPCDEQTARRAAAAFRPKPVELWQLPALPVPDAADGLIQPDDEDFDEPDDMDGL